jgi:hypothetical protein
LLKGHGIDKLLQQLVDKQATFLKADFSLSCESVRLSGQKFYLCRNQLIKKSFVLLLFGNKFVVLLIYSFPSPAQAAQSYEGWGWYEKGASNAAGSALEYCIAMIS